MRTIEERYNLVKVMKSLDSNIVELYHINEELSEILCMNLVTMDTLLVSYTSAKGYALHFNNGATIFTHDLSVVLHYISEQVGANALTRLHQAYHDLEVEQFELANKQAQLELERGY